jgi:hypothetical protein
MRPRSTGRSIHNVTKSGPDPPCYALLALGFQVCMRPVHYGSSTVIKVARAEGYYRNLTVPSSDALHL